MIGRLQAPLCKSGATSYEEKRTESQLRIRSNDFDDPEAEKGTMDSEVYDM